MKRSFDNAVTKQNICKKRPCLIWSLCLNILLYCYIIFITNFKDILNDIPLAEIILSNSNSINKQCPPQFPTETEPCSIDTWKYLKELGLYKFGHCDINNCSSCISADPHKVAKLWKIRYNDNKQQRIDDLYKLLKHIKTVNVMVVNSGFSYLFLNWVCSVTNNLSPTEYKYIFRHTLLIITNHKIAEQINGLNLGFMVHEPIWLGPYILEKMMTDKPSDAFATDSFKYLVTLQVMICKDLIEMNKNVLIQDVDIIWKENVFQYIYDEYMHENIDILMQYDARYDIFGPGNSGFLFIKSNCLTKIFMESMIDYISVILHGNHDQVLWNFLLHWKPFRQINFKLFDEDLFLNGYKVNIHGGHDEDLFEEWFEYKLNIENRNKYYMFHASW
eukprot:334010_1